MTFALDDTAPAATCAAWQERALAALKGAPFERLVSASLDGLRIGPLYPPAGDTARALRIAPGPWQVAQRVDHPDTSAANAQALIDLAGGADALTLVTSAAPAAHGAGVNLANLADLADTLTGVRLDLIGLRIDAGGDAPRIAGLLAGLVRQQRLDPAQLRIDFGCDPVAMSAGEASDIGPVLGATARSLTAQGFAGTTHIADGRAWHNAGASEAQELGYVLASAVETMRLMEAQGISLADTAADLTFLLAADADVFLGLAKFRALRLLWARVLASCGLAPRPIRIHAQTSWRMLTQRDPHVNILRSGAGVFAAGLGSADCIAVLPYTTALGLPDAAARRIARNTSLVFLEEAHLGKVADPAAGAGSFEALTAGLCEKAWTIFQMTHCCGGLLAALQQNHPQDMIAQSAQARARAIATRRQPLTGISEFAALDEVAASVEPVALRPPVAAILPARRDAHPFEALRDKADAVLASTGARPAVFLANIGHPGTFAARTLFARGVFEAGGVAAVVSGGLADAQAAASAFAASGARAACICGLDATYAQQGAAVAQALRTAGARHVLLAGRPGPAEAALRAAGVSGFAYVGADVVALLQDVLG